jgi:hypothetical protein
MPPASAPHDPMKNAGIDRTATSSQCDSPELRKTVPGRRLLASERACPQRRPPRNREQRLSRFCAIARCSNPRRVKNAGIDKGITASQRDLIELQFKQSLPSARRRLMRSEQAGPQRQPSATEHFFAAKRPAGPLLLPEQFSRFSVSSDIIDRWISLAKPTLLSRYFSLFDRVGK